MDSDLLAVAFFTPLVGAAFHVATADGPVVLRLTEVTPLPPPRHRTGAGAVIPAAELPARAEPFSLLFIGPPDRLLPQATYRMSRAADATPLEVFIVPIAREREGFLYQAVFG